MRDDLLPRNVAEGERPPSSRSREEAKDFSADQVRALLSAAAGTRNYVLYAVAVPTGLHQGELLGLGWDDFDLDGSTPKLSVRRALKVTLGFGTPKNKTSRRSVRLNRSATAALKEHRLRQKEERLRAPGWRDRGLAFPNTAGGPMDHNNLYQRDYKRLLKAAGLDGQGSRSTRCVTPSRRGSSCGGSTPRRSSRCLGIPASCRRWTPTRT